MIEVSPVDPTRSKMYSVAASRWVLALLYTLAVAIGFLIGATVHEPLQVSWVMQEGFFLFSLQGIGASRDLLMVLRDRNHTTMPRMEWQGVDHLAAPVPDSDPRISQTIQNRQAAVLEHYYEALVQPAMFVHEGPKTVAIIGERESLAVEEVLKHKTVVSVTFIDLSEISEILDSCRLSSNATWPGTCLDHSRMGMDDPRVKSHVGVDSFIYKYLADADQLADEMLFDVIVLDSDISASAGTILASEAFQKALHTTLDTNGLLVTNSGQETLPRMSPKARPNTAVQWKERLVQSGFDSIQEYEDVLRFPRQSGPRRTAAIANFIAAFKILDSKFRWFSNEAETNLDIVKRSIPSSDDGIPFRYFDGAKMESYRYPSKAVEVEYCRQRLDSYGCGKGSVFDPSRQNVLSSSFIVKPSMVPNAGRGVFALESTPKGSYIALEECVESIHFPESTASLVYLLVDNPFVDYWDTWETYVDGYGFPSNLFGTVAADVDPGILTFVNHGCNGTYNVGSGDDHINEKLPSPGSGLTNECHVRTVRQPCGAVEVVFAPLTLLFEPYNRERNS